MSCHDISMTTFNLISNSGWCSTVCQHFIFPFSYLMRQSQMNTLNQPADGKKTHDWQKKNFSFNEQTLIQTNGGPTREQRKKSFIIICSLTAQNVMSGFFSPPSSDHTIWLNVSCSLMLKIQKKKKRNKYLGNRQETKVAVTLTCQRCRPRSLLRQFYPCLLIWHTAAVTVLVGDALLDTPQWSSNDLTGRKYFGNSVTVNKVAEVSQERCLKKWSVNWKMFPCLFQV